MPVTFTVSDRVPRVAISKTVALPRVGSWQLVYLLGEGSWSAVYQARPIRGASDEPGDYAVKVLKPEHGKNSVALEMLRTESRVAKTVSNPHLSTVLSAQHTHSPYYTVMPRLVGGTAQAILTESTHERDAKETAEGAPECTPLATPYALWIARQVTEALLALHSAGWIHCDIKPSNIFVSPQGHATLIDLGFARRIARHEQNASGGLNQADIFAGTPAYAAPEAFDDEPILDSSSDIYSLGATLFEMVTGRRLYAPNDPAKLAECHLHEPPPDARRLAPHLHPRVSRLIQRMLSKEPHWRPTTLELLENLVRLEIDTLDERLPLVL